MYKCVSVCLCIYMFLFLSWKSEDSTPQKNLESIQRALVKVIEADKSHSDFIVSKVSDTVRVLHDFLHALF